MDQPTNNKPSFGENLRNLFSRAAKSQFAQQIGEAIKQELPNILNAQPVSANQLQNLSDGLKDDVANLIAVSRHELETLNGRSGRDQLVLEMALIRLENVTGRLEYMLAIYTEALRHTDPRLAAVQVDNGGASTHRGGRALPRLSGGQRRHLSDYLRFVLQNTITMATSPMPTNGAQPASAYATAGTIKHLQGMTIWLRQALDHAYEELYAGVR